MPSLTYEKRRGQLETYFDRTAVEAWAKLTSEAPVSRIRATVRAGRDRMRQTFLDWLPTDMSGRRVLDAGCGTGALSFDLARRGAEVVAIDLSPTLIELARERAPSDLGDGSVQFIAGDMLKAPLGDFDHVVAMDSLIHYRTEDAVKALAVLGSRASESILFTFAPRTPALTAMHLAGKLFPRGNRAPAIQPTGADRIRRLIDNDSGLLAWRTARSHHIASSFYQSQAQELIAA